MACHGFYQLALLAERVESRSEQYVVALVVERMVQSNQNFGKKRIGDVGNDYADRG